MIVCVNFGIDSWCGFNRFSLIFFLWALLSCSSARPLFILSSGCCSSAGSSRVGPAAQVHCQHCPFVLGRAPLILAPSLFWLAERCSPCRASLCRSRVPFSLPLCLDTTRSPLPGPPLAPSPCGSSPSGAGTSPAPCTRPAPSGAHHGPRWLRASSFPFLH